MSASPLSISLSLMETMWVLPGMLKLRVEADTAARCLLTVECSTRLIANSVRTGHLAGLAPAGWTLAVPLVGRFITVQDRSILQTALSSRTLQPVEVCIRCLDRDAVEVEW